MNIFEIATKNKYRFDNGRTILSTEDLWDLPLRGQYGLDTVAKKLSKIIKESEEESFVKTKSSSTKELETMFGVVKYIIDFKLEEEEKKKAAAEAKAKKEKIMEILERKQQSELEEKSAEELQKMLEELN